MTSCMTTVSRMMTIWRCWPVWVDAGSSGLGAWCLAGSGCCRRLLLLQHTPTLPVSSHPPWHNHPHSEAPLWKPNFQFLTFFDILPPRQTSPHPQCSSVENILLLSALPTKLSKTLSFHIFIYQWVLNGCYLQMPNSKTSTATCDFFRWKIEYFLSRFS